MNSDRERTQEVCGWIQHHWIETYYGIQCEQCGLFYPYGCEPWLPDEDNLDEEYYADEDE